MAAAGQLCLLYLLAGLLPRLGAAFNLDTREDNVIRKYGDPGSLFGFSLAMHWQLQPEDKRLRGEGAPCSRRPRGGVGPWAHSAPSAHRSPPGPAPRGASPIQLGKEENPRAGLAPGRAFAKLTVHPVPPADSRGPHKN
ncbi:hypothetical protein P7K49_013977 [Saguinus oedipus]|uniref:Uncharacterized protein n=1 Tax=Saguinus oedipus TaxID=9490 RepID=A0ABQ9VHG5_SAGOE|nr:hypothetical protein P7K49_013977 [Saguinus oedipus]